MNAANGRKNKVLNLLTNKLDSVPGTARQYKASGLRWVVIGDENFGEGSSREHAALEIRHLGGFAVVAKSFARIHETNLKKQGVLPLTFAGKSDYDMLQETDTIDVLCTGLVEGKCLTMRVHRYTGVSFDVQLQHSLNGPQIEWFKEGSALNAMAKEQISGV